MSTDEHLRVHSRCGACGYLFGVKDQFYVFTNGTDESPYGITRYGYFDFPTSLHCSNMRLCRRPSCKTCPSVETSTVHKHCLELFLCRFGASDVGGSLTENNTKLHLLWVAATRRSLWKGASNLNVWPSVYPDFSDVQNIVGGGRSIGWQKLPQEIIEIIWDLCNDWYRSVLDLIDQLPTLRNDVHLQQRTIPLTDIKDWIRGNTLRLGSHPNDSIIRLTSDFRGLARIEKLERLDADGRSRSNYMGYIVGVAEQFHGAFVDFQFGMARLRGLTGPIYIWDTPCPPPLHRSVVDVHIVAPTPHPHDVQLGTVNLPICTGITLFVAHDSTYAVHAHTKADPYAHKTFENLPPSRQKTVAWIYLPIHGKVTELGFSCFKNQHGLVPPPQHLLFRFESARDVLIGPYKTTPRDFVSLRMPQTLIYKRNDDLPICFIGGFSENDSIHGTDPPKQPSRTPSTWWVAPPCISSAPLENIYRVRVYYIPETSFCRGLILEYETGGSRALGQCRLGVDHFREFERPTRLCFTNTTSRRFGEKQIKGVQIQIECSDHHVHVDERVEWTCCEMVGILYAWFDKDEIQLEYENTS